MLPSAGRKVRPIQGPSYWRMRVPAARVAAPRERLLSEQSQCLVRAHTGCTDFSKAAAEAQANFEGADLFNARIHLA